MTFLVHYDFIFRPLWSVKPSVCYVEKNAVLENLLWSPKKIYPYRSIGIRHPPSSSIETTFPCLYNCSVCCILQQLSVCITAKNPQYRYTDREKESQLMMTGGAYTSTRIYLLWTIPLINEIFQTLLWRIYLRIKSTEAPNPFYISLVWRRYDNIPNCK